jgi:hypothetical protein
LWNAFHSPRGLDATVIVMTVVIACGITWWIYGGARRMWLETGLYLRAEEEQITVATRAGRRTLRWDEIYAFTTEDCSTRGERGWWLSLRGREDEFWRSGTENGVVLTAARSSVAMKSKPSLTRNCANWAA